MEIEKIKAVLAFPLALSMAYDKAKADGVVDYKDLPLLMAPSMLAIPAIQAVPEVLSELKSLTVDEKNAVNQWVQDTYDVADDDVEAKVEGALALMGDVAVYVAGWVKDA